MSKFQEFQARLNDLREKASQYEDKDQLLKSIKTVEKAWEEAAKAANLLECTPVKAALEATQRSSDILAYNILYASTGDVSPEQLLASVVKFQALEQIRGAFSSTMAEALEEGVEAGLIADEIEKK
jgi:predicted nuclease with TOPRIM domain